MSRKVEKATGAALLLLAFGVIFSVFVYIKGVVVAIWIVVCGLVLAGMIITGIDLLLD